MFVIIFQVTRPAHRGRGVITASWYKTKAPQNTELVPKVQRRRRDIGAFANHAIRVQKNCNVATLGRESLLKGRSQPRNKLLEKVAGG